MKLFSKDVSLEELSNLVNELLKEISNAITSGTTETQPDYTALGVVLLGGLVVGYVFALKDKQWAKILVYVIMGLLIVELYQSLLGVNTFAVLLKKEIENSSSGMGISTNEEFMNMISALTGIDILFGGSILAYASEIVYFALDKKEVKQNDENSIESENN